MSNQIPLIGGHGHGKVSLFLGDTMYSPFIKDDRFDVYMKELYRLREYRQGYLTYFVYVVDGMNDEDLYVAFRKILPTLSPWSVLDIEDTFGCFPNPEK